MCLPDGYIPGQHCKREKVEAANASEEQTSEVA
jgi:hypothetical protein